MGCESWRRYGEPERVRRVFLQGITVLSDLMTIRRDGRNGHGHVRDRTMWERGAKLDESLCRLMLRMLILSVSQSPPNLVVD